MHLLLFFYQSPCLSLVELLKIPLLLTSLLSFLMNLPHQIILNLDLLLSLLHLPLVSSLLHIQLLTELTRAFQTLQTLSPADYTPIEARLLLNLLLQIPSPFF